jgi:Fe-S cluster assembly protein SufD
MSSAVKKLCPMTLPDVPTTAFERFKYTDIPSALKKIPLTQGTVAMRPIEDCNYWTASAEKLPAWAQKMFSAVPAGDATYKDMMLWHRANATSDVSAVLDVPANTHNQRLEVERIIQTGSVTPRLFIQIGANTDFTFIEHHNGNGACWDNSVTQIHVAKGARLRHYRVQTNGADVVYTQNTHVVLERDATYEAFVLTMGSALSRNQIHAEMKGENAEVRLAGVNLLRGTQHGDTTITIEHQAPHCRSNQTYKTILTDKAHGVFQGKVHVHQVAQKTDGYQLSNTLLLSPHAIMDTKPELEIYADDVKCSHGATTGQLDTAPLFYLRSRGLSEAQAKFLLMQAYLGPALDEIRDDEARAQITAIATQWLEQVSG